MSDRETGSCYASTNIYFERAWLMLNFPQKPMNFLRYHASFLLDAWRLGNKMVPQLAPWQYVDGSFTGLSRQLYSHSPTTLILKTSIWNAYMNIHSHRMKVYSPLPTLDLLDICIFCKLLTLWYSYLIFCKI